MARLERLKIKKLRNIEPDTELTFAPGHNILLGPNGTGKTTLLRLISLVPGASGKPFSDDQLDIEYVVGVQGGNVHVDLATARIEQLDMFPEDLADQAERSKQRSEPYLSRAFHPTLTLNGNGARLVFKNENDGVRVQCEAGKLFHEAASEKRIAGQQMRPDNFYSYILRISGLLVESYRRHVLAMGFELRDRASDAHRFDEALGFYDVILGRDPSATDITYHAQIEVDFEPDDSTSTTWSNSLIPRELSDYLSSELYALRQRDPKITSTRSDLRLSTPEGPVFLNQFVNIADLFAGSLRTAVSERLEEDGWIRLIYSAFDYHFQIDKFRELPSDKLSFGQKRLLAFFYYLALNPDIVIADELTNGMHHAWVERCMELMKGRQTFLALQNPLLLDFLEFENVEEVRQTFTLCGLKRDAEGRGIVTYSKMSEAMAADFYKAYQAGYQHVSEILRVHGLW